MYRRILIVFLLCSFLVTACSAPNTPIITQLDRSEPALQQAAPSQSAGVQSEPSASAPPTDIVSSDNFENIEKLLDARWPRWTGDEGTTDYHEGAYRINVLTSDYFMWSYMEGPGNVKDVTVEVDAVELPQSLGQFGLICRATRTDDFYMFLVSSDGFAQIVKYKLRAPEAERFVALASNDYSDAIAESGVRNHIRADCVGTTLTLFVNGEELLKVDDAELGRGRVGLIAYAPVDGTVDVLFDNFVVAKPRPAPPQGRNIALASK